MLTRDQLRVVILSVSQAHLILPKDLPGMEKLSCLATSRTVVSCVIIQAMVSVQNIKRHRMKPTA